MSHESTAEPIKVGYLMDVKLPDAYPAEMRADLTQPFGRYTRRGWMGAGYLVARPLDPDGTTAHLVERFGQD